MTSISLVCPSGVAVNLSACHRTYYEGARTALLTIYILTLAVVASRSLFVIVLPGSQ